MQKARNNFLPRSGRTADQNPAVSRRHLFHRLANLRNGWRCTDKGRVVANLHAQFVILTAQLERLDGSLHNEDQPVGLEGLLDEIIGALLDRGDGRLDIPVAADDHDREIGMTLADDIQQFKTVEPASLEPDIEDDESGTARLYRGQRLVAVARAARIVAFIVQDARYQLANIGFIIDYQNIRRH